MKRYIRSTTSLSQLVDKWMNTPKYHLGPKAQKNAELKYGDNIYQVVEDQLAGMNVLIDYLLECGFEEVHKNLDFLQNHWFINEKLGVPHVYAEGIDLTENANGIICITISRVFNNDPNRECVSTKSFIDVLQSSGFTITYKHHTYREGYGQGLKITVGR